MAGTGKGITPRQRELDRRIRARREGLGLSQEALALRADINRTYIGSLEGGQRNPSLENIVKLAVALEVDAGLLVEGFKGSPGADTCRPPPPRQKLRRIVTGHSYGLPKVTNPGRRSQR